MTEKIILPDSRQVDAYKSAIEAVRRAARRCLDDTTSPFELSEDKDFRDMLFYIEGVRAMETSAVNSIRTLSENAQRAGARDGE